MNTLITKLERLAEVKQEIRNALLSKGVHVTDGDSFFSYAGKILDLPVQSNHIPVLDQDFTFLATPEPSGTVIYCSPEGSGTRNGSSWENAYPGVYTGTAENVYLLEGDYGDKSNNYGRNYYGGFPAENPTWSRRDPFLYPSYWSPNFQGNNTYGIIDGVHLYSSLATIKANTIRNCRISDVARVKTDNSIYNTVFCGIDRIEAPSIESSILYDCDITKTVDDSSISFVTGDLINCIVANCRCSGPTVYASTYGTQYEIIHGMKICEQCRNTIFINCRLAYDISSSYYLGIAIKSDETNTFWTKGFTAPCHFADKMENCMILDCRINVKIAYEPGATIPDSNGTYYMPSIPAYPADEMSNCVVVNSEFLTDPACNFQYTGINFSTFAHCKFSYTMTDNILASIFYNSVFGEETLAMVINPDIVINQSYEDFIFTDPGNFIPGCTEETCPDPSSRAEFITFCNSYGNWQPIKDNLLQGTAAKKVFLTTDINGTERSNPTTPGAYESATE